ncbi:MAG TPA: TIGR00730 family Rossman fold protein [Candidatus Babeliales bacterium]|jgi:hypothetical protein|nr:TIGR00730 family Rossman fold protein [Candidatus Babeliales bacterium]
MISRLRQGFGTFFSLLKVMTQLLYGIWYISRLPRPIITIFGGSRIKSDDYYAFQAMQLSQRFIDHNVSVLTGGGPGIMEAASCGALYSKKGKGKSVGIGVHNIHEHPNKCSSAYFELDQFFARKWLLIRYSFGFIVFPGGFGTLDELFEVLTLMQTSVVGFVPIVLVGKEYWQPFVDWVENESIKHGLIRKKELEWIVITDDLDIIFDTIHRHCKEKK